MSGFGGPHQAYRRTVRLSARRAIPPPPSSSMRTYQPRREWPVRPTMSERDEGPGRGLVRRRTIRKPSSSGEIPVLTKRAPMLLLRLSGESLLRFADRTLWALLLKLPVRADDVRRDALLPWPFRCATPAGRYRSASLPLPKAPATPPADPARNARTRTAPRSLAAPDCKLSAPLNRGSRP